MGRLQVIAIIIFSGFVLTKILPSTPASPASTASSASPPRPELTAEQAVEKAQSNARFKATTRVLAIIKSNMRDPDSLKWDRILANEDGTVVCVTYRGRNGFGGMNFEHVTYTQGSISQSKNAWNKSCAEKSLYEMKHAQYALK